jgi:hypothetical protein
MRIAKPQPIPPMPRTITSPLQSMPRRRTLADIAMRRGLALACALLVAGCAARGASPEAFQFGVMGDTPYGAREEPHFLAMMERMNAAPLAFVVHLGDFKAGGDSPCSDALFEKRKAQLDGSKHPLVYTPGDNEWTDCRRPSNGGMDALERLAKLRQLFFADGFSLGQTRMATAFQGDCVERKDEACICGAHPENRMWTHLRVRFVSLNFPGKGNNVGYDRASDEEARCRTLANRLWLERAVAESEGAGTRALVVMTQANPWAGRNKLYEPFLREMAAAAQRLRKPVLFMHGDTHLYRFDTPFVDAMGQPLANPLRLETYGSPFVGWERVTVDPDDPKLFSVEPRLDAVVPR